MRTIVLKIKTILLVVVLLTSPAIAAELAELKIVTSSDSVTQGEQILVTVMHNGMPVENVFLQFCIDGGTPIYAKTNATGRAVFKSDITGTLKIVAMKDDEMSASKYITVTQSSDGGGGDGGGGDSDGGKSVVHVDISHRYKGDIYSGDITFESGMTALDALDNASKRGGFSYNSREESFGTYVYTIAGIEEKSEGPISGWMYWVNYPHDPQPNIVSDEYKLKRGDVVTWYWSTSMDSKPPQDPHSTYSWTTPTPTPTPVPTKRAEENKTIEFIEAGKNASLTFNKTEITRFMINANNTIRTAEVSVEQLEKPANITNVSGIPYCYFNVTTTNLTDADITSATIEFKVNKTWINDSKVDEATITLNRYNDNNWSALPTSKIKEDNASLYFESETPGFSLFAISGEERTAHLARAEPEAETEAEIKTPMPGVPATPIPTSTLGTIPTTAPVPKIPMFLIVIVIAVIGIAGMIIVVLSRK